MGFKMKSSIDNLCSPLKETKEQTKRAVINKKSSAYGSSGGYESTEFVKGGRKGIDKTTKSTTYKKSNADTDGANPETYTKTKTKINKKGERKTKTKQISAKKYNRQVARKKKRAERRGDDTENYSS